MLLYCIVRRLKKFVNVRQFLYNMTMKLGIKVGLLGDSYTDLIKSQPDFCEVWFDSRKINLYDKLFHQIKSLKIDCGLHFWGATKDNFLANIAFPDQKILQDSLSLIKKTIDTASNYGFSYVNIHPGSTILTKVNLDNGPLDFSATKNKTTLELATKTLRNSLFELSQYAKNKHIKFYLESVPMYCYKKINHIINRNIYEKIGELPLAIIKQMMDIDNLYFTNDFGHTLANSKSTNRYELIKYLVDESKNLLSKTKLLHVGFIIPPYNGTDYHGCLYEKAIENKIAIPNKSEIISLLKMYDKQNVWALAEPAKDHVGNFLYLKQLYQLSLK
jgi:hypothetical protein